MKKEVIVGVIVILAAIVVVLLVTTGWPLTGQVAGQGFTCVDSDGEDTDVLSIGATYHF